MPIYEYKCNACGAEFSLLVMGSSQKIACSSCGSEDVSKKLSAFSCSLPSGSGHSFGGGGGGFSGGG